MKPENVKAKIPEDTKARWPNADIDYLILDDGDFIVFIDSDIDVDWETSDAYDEEGAEDPKRHNDILNRVATIECIPNDHQKVTIRMNFKRMIGWFPRMSRESDKAFRNRRPRWRRSGARSATAEVWYCRYHLI